MSKSKNRQLLLDVRLYRVCCDGFVEIEVQARSAAAELAARLQRFAELDKDEGR